MSTLILRLAAPMQAWGSDAKYNYRTTGREPTKSGVLGMLAAALGCPRDDREEIARLSELRFGVRADREGKVIRDYQTACARKKGGLMTYGELQEDRAGRGEVTLTYRDYLCDAVFVVGLEGPGKYLETLQEALRHPVYPLFLGRRSCPPVGPVCLGIREEGLEETLRSLPLQIRPWQKPAGAVRLILEGGPGSIQDVPISYSPLKREFGFRGIREEILAISSEEGHDPMAEL